MCTCSCEAEGPEFWRESFPIARKSHVCCECGSIIDPGEKYNHLSGMWNDTGFETFKTCMTCFSIRLEASDVLGCTPPFECLYETVGSSFEYAVI